MFTVSLFIQNFYSVTPNETVRVNLFSLSIKRSLADNSGSDFSSINQKLFMRAIPCNGERSGPNQGQQIGTPPLIGFVPSIIAYGDRKNSSLLLMVHDVTWPPNNEYIILEFAFSIVLNVLKWIG